LHEVDFESSGFQWIESNDWNHSVLVFLRIDKNKKEKLIVICNFVPTPWYNYRIGVPENGIWREILNSDGSPYGGSEQGNMGKVKATPAPMHGFDFSINVTIPPLGILFLKKIAVNSVD
jgi:1,4-alpha-glucan branching enzyme